MPRDASELARRLARDAEAVCRHYLSKGRREGRYWTVGDVRNTPGRSMFVRLSGPDSGPGAAGRWTDAATAEHGDLLDVIREALGLTSFAEVLKEAWRFLGDARGPAYSPLKPRAARSRARSAETARRLFSMSQPIAGTLAETYLHTRGLTNLSGTESLRFHPRCWWRPDIGQTEAHPALIAAVTDLDGRITGVHRTWLAADGSDKAAIDPPRKVMGELLGNAVHFGVVDDVLAAGEGIETVLSLRQALSVLPVIAALSAAHLAAVRLPATCRRLYVLRDRDPAGECACHCLVDRAKALGIEAVTLVPRLWDFNEDLCSYGAGGLGDWIRTQLVGDDAERFRARVA